jgi:hypothetical protein
MHAHGLYPNGIDADHLDVNRAVGGCVGGCGARRGRVSAQDFMLTKGIVRAAQRVLHGGPRMISARGDPVTRKTSIVYRIDCQFEAGFCQHSAKNARFSAIIEGLHVLGYGKPDNSTDAFKWGPRDISSRR